VKKAFLEGDGKLSVIREDAEQPSRPPETRRS